VALRCRKHRLIASLETAALQHGLELVDLELTSYHGQRIVRVYLEATAVDGQRHPLDLDELAAANSWVDAILEVDPPYNGAYLLEVSSAGLDRPLRTLEHFRRFCGERVKLSSEAVDGRRNWTGELAGVLDGVADSAIGSTTGTTSSAVGQSEVEAGQPGALVLVKLDGLEEPARIPFAMIRKAHVQAKLQFNNGKGQ